MNLLNHMLDAVPATMIACDRDGKILHVNQQWILAFAPDHSFCEIIGTNLRDHFSKAVVETINQRTEEVWQSGEVRDYDVTLVLHQGVRVFMVNKFPLYEDGRIVAVGTSATDITERRRQQARAAIERERSDRLEAIGELSAGVAHDFNNLLGVIDIYTAFARKDRQDYTKFDGDMEQIQAAVKSGSSLVDSLLTFSRRSPGDREQLIVREVANDMAAMFRRILNANITIQTIYDGENGWVVVADRAQLERTFVNLVVNAKDAMPDGGQLTINIERCVRDETRYVRVQFTDTGVGMTDEVKAKVFEPFFTTKPKGMGSGLGLATVYGVVRDIGGIVEVESTPGHGTTFTLWIPAFDPVEIETLTLTSRAS